VESHGNVYEMHADHICGVDWLVVIVNLNHGISLMYGVAKDYLGYL